MRFTDYFRYDEDKKVKHVLGKLYKGVKIPWLSIILGGFLAVFNALVILTQFENYNAIFTGTMQDLSPLFAYLTASFVQYLLIFASVISSLGLVRVVTGVRRKVWKKMLHLPVRTFEKETPEGMLSRITSDAEYASQPFTVVIVILQILTYFMSMTAAAPKDLPQALPFLIVSGVLALACVVFSARCTSRSVAEVQNCKSEQTADLSEKLANIRLIKASRAEESVIELSERLIDERYKADVKDAFAKGLQAVASNCTYIIIYSCAFLGGIAAIAKGAISDVAPINAVYVFGMALELTLVAVMGIPATFAGAVGGAKKLASVFDMEEEDTESGRALGDPGDLEADGISFAYEEEKVLDGLSLTIPKGKVTAIVGSNGSGKSTLAKIINRLYPLQSGELRIGGENAADLSLASYRKAFGVVSQDASLFSGSIRDNICYGADREVSDAELAEVIRRAGLEDVIAAHSEGLDYDIGLKGSRLSGGQQQRVAIARALLRDPEYLILDEATANLDAKTEAEVTESLKELMKDRTVIVIAHDYSAVKGVDRIVVLKDGAVEDIGTEQELLERNRYFRTLSRQN